MGRPGIAAFTGESLHGGDAMGSPGTAAFTGDDGLQYSFEQEIRSIVKLKGDKQEQGCRVSDKQFRIQSVPNHKLKGHLAPDLRHNDVMHKLYCRQTRPRC